MYSKDFLRWPLSLEKPQRESIANMKIIASLAYENCLSVILLKIFANLLHFLQNVKKLLKRSTAAVDILQKEAAEGHSEDGGDMGKRAVDYGFGIAPVVVYESRISRTGLWRLSC